MGYLLIGIILIYFAYHILSKQNNTVQTDNLKLPESKNEFDDSWLVDFWDTTQYYPQWILKDRKYIWPLIKSAIKISEKRYDLALNDENLFSIITLKDFEDGLTEIEIYYNQQIVCAFIAKYELDTEFHVDWFELEEVKFKKEGHWQNQIKDFINWNEAKNKNQEKEEKLKEEIELKKQMDKKLE